MVIKNWKKLCEKAKELGYSHNEATVWNNRHYYTGEILSLEGISFTKDGTISIDGAGIITYDRTPKQMLMIMEALK